MDFKKTDRSFLIGKFSDYYGSECSLQASSLAYPAAIWLGVDKVKVEVMENGRWQEQKIPEEASINSRMHLTQDMVKELLPALQKFAETGEL